MTSEQALVCIGAIGGAHGVQGEVRVRSFTLVPEDCFAYGPLLDENGQEVIQPKTVRPAKNHFVVVPKSTKTREDWEAMKGTKLYVPKSALPPPEEDEYYYDDLVGLTVLHTDGRDLGQVKAVQNFGADDLLEIIAPDRRSAYYLPFTNDVIPVVRLEEKEILAEPDESYCPKACKSHLKPKISPSGADHRFRLRCRNRHDAPATSFQADQISRQTDGQKSRISIGHASACDRSPALQSRPSQPV